MNRLEDKIHVNNSINIGKAFDKYQNPLMIKLK